MTEPAKNGNVVMSAGPDLWQDGRDVAAAIPPRARRVVDLGCGAGQAGELFLRIQPEADYWGFEAEPGLVFTAAEHLSHAVQMQPECLDFQSLGLRPGSVQALVIRGAFLRGLTAERLRKWAELLDEAGQVSILCPNPSYIRTVLARLAGKQERGAGLAARAACSLSELQELVREAGLTPCSAKPLASSSADAALRNSPELAAFLQSFAGLMPRLGWQDVRTDIWSQGWIVKASRRSVPRAEQLIVHTVIGEGIVTARVRVEEPAAFLRTEAGVEAVNERKSYNSKVDASFGRRVFIRQRIMYPSVEMGLAAIDSLRGDGYLILSEIDDNPILWEKSHPETSSLSFLGTHAVQVSTEPLAEIIRRFNPCVHVFRNELKELPPRRVYGGGEEAPVTVFFGALNRGEEWQEIMPALNEAARRYGAGLHFKVLSDRSFFEALETGHKEFVELEGRDYGGQYVPYGLYQQALHSSDIALLPLHDTEFNRTKSDLKFIESAAHGAVALASPTVYQATLRDGRTGFLYHDAQEFAERLRLLIEDRERRWETAEAAYRYVASERLLSKHYLERLAWYRELFERRDELDKALAMRMEQLRKERKEVQA